MPNGEHRGISPAWLAVALNAMIVIMAGAALFTRLETVQGRLSEELTEEIAERRVLEQEVRTLQTTVQYLCNERRRDNLDAGRNATAAC